MPLIQPLLSFLEISCVTAGPAAVHSQALTGDVTGHIAVCDKEGGICDFVGIALTMLRNMVEQALHGIVLCPKSSGLVHADGAGSNAVDADVVVCKLKSHSLGHIDDAGLCSGKCNLISERHHTYNRAYVDDVGALSLAEVGNNIFRALINAVHIYADNLFPPFVREFVDVETLLGRNVNTGVVDPDVDSAESFNDVCKTGLYGLVVANVEFEEFGLSAVLFDFLGDGLPFSILLPSTATLAPIFGKILCHIASECSGRAGDTDGLAGKIEICHNINFLF